MRSRNPPGQAAGFAVLFFCLAAVNTGFAHGAPQKLPTSVLEIEKSGGGSVPVLAEIAVSDTERGTGLMYRKSLADGEGMLFVFDRDQKLSFYMRNTLIPLSIAFISSDGRITEIRDMQPLDETSIVSVRSVRYALEAPQGWFTREGIEPGDTVKGIPDF
jgi:uncharacterized membrane protein (UPF0127 family)